MSKARERFRSVLSRDTCTVAANIFDPLSARIAEMLNYEVCFLSGSVGKAANLGVPDLVMYNMSDGPDPGLYSKTEQVGKLTAASSARRDPGTVIVARTAALAQCPLEEALDRISAYSTTGVEAIRLTGIKTREQLIAVHQATKLPLTTLSPPTEILNDRHFLAENGLRILMLGNPAFSVAVKGIYDCLNHLKSGGTLEDLPMEEASPALLREVSRIDELTQLQSKYLPK